MAGKVAFDGLDHRGRQQNVETGLVVSNKDMKDHMALVAANGASGTGGGNGDIIIHPVAGEKITIEIPPVPGLVQSAEPGGQGVRAKPDLPKGLHSDTGYTAPKTGNTPIEAPKPSAAGPG